jgi:hypothetical protein
MMEVFLSFFLLYLVESIVINDIFKKICWVEYIGVLAKVLTMYQFTLLLLSFIPLFPDSWSSLNRHHFCIYLHVHILFALCPHSPSPTGRTCSIL